MITESITVYVINNRRMSVEMNPLNKILEELPRLTENELEQVKQKVLFLQLSDTHPTGSTKQNEKTQPAMAEDIQNALSSLFTERKQSDPSSLSRHSQLNHTIHSKVKEIQPFLSQIIKPKHTLVERQSIWIFCLKLLAKRMDQESVPVTSKTMIHHLHRIPFVFDESFPMYLERGIAHIVIQSIMSQKITETVQDKP